MGPAGESGGRESAVGEEAEGAGVMVVVGGPGRGVIDIVECPKCHDLTTVLCKTLARSWGEGAVHVPRVGM